jgi:hypothetical protein
MFSESSPPLPWDENHTYTRDTIELYYQVCTKHYDYICLTRKKNLSIMRCSGFIEHYDKSALMASFDDS